MPTPPSRFHRTGFALLLAPIFVGIASCHAGDPPCPNDLPASCPDGGAPSYQSQIAPLLGASCVRCHSPTGSAFDKPLGTYAQVYALRTEVLSEVYGCLMPPRDDGPLAPSERSILLTWLVCRAPDN